MKYLNICIVLLAMSGFLIAQPVKVVSGVFSSGFVRSESNSNKLGMICALPFVASSKSIENIAEIGFFHKKVKTNSTTEVVSETRSLSILGVYPNPVIDKATVRFSNNNGSSVSFQLTDLNGNVKQVINNLEAGSYVNTYDLSMDNLPSGTYLLKMTSGTELVITKILKI
jgi:hypothetical protein